MIQKAFAAGCSIVLFAALSLWAGENIMKVHDVVAEPGDTITIKVEIINDEEFVGFNFDLPLPPGFAFVKDSEKLHRDKGHYFTFGHLEGNVIRTLSVSMQTIPYEGNSGVIVSFDVVAPGEPRKHELSLVRPVIGNIHAQNILTATVHGRVIIHAP